MSTPYPILDWDDAYANGAYIEGADAYPPRWDRDAAQFRTHLSASGKARLDLPYGGGERQSFDLFLPEATPKGLVVFVHGGYWKAFDKTSWSHLAAGPLAHGHAVAMPSYPLAPEARIGEIVRQVAMAITKAAEMVDGPIRLAGHSAGGHLVSRMIASPSPLAAPVLERVANTLSISGLHDLRPLQATAMNETLKIDHEEAAAESPALLRPVPGKRIVAWVGAKERPEFLRQNRLIGLVWDGFGIQTSTQEEPGRHHFDVIDGLKDPRHPLVAALLS